MTTSPDSIVRGCGRGLEGVQDLSGCMLKCVAALPWMTCSVRASWLAVFDACITQYGAYPCHIFIIIHVQYMYKYTYMYTCMCVYMYMCMVGMTG